MSKKIFILADTHLGGNEVKTPDFIQALKNMRAIAPEASLFHLGDFTNFSNDDIFEEELALMAEAGFKQIAITLGNHDVRGYKGGDSEVVDEKGWLDNWKKVWYPEDSLNDPRFLPYKKAIATFTNFKQRLGLSPVLYDEQIVEGYHVLNLCTERPFKDQCYLSEMQLHWLDIRLAEIRKTTEEPIFILSHQALNDTHRGANEYGGFGDQDQQVKAIFEKYNNLIFLSGHIHNGLGVAEILPTTYGYLVDAPSFCSPDVGLEKRSISYLLEASPEKLVFTPYYVGTEANPVWEELADYTKTIVLK